MPALRRTIYGDSDPRELPAYSLTEASRLTGVGRSTLGNWTWGSVAVAGRQRVRPVIQPGEAGRFVSFFSLAEFHVLAALRRTHGLSLQKIRRAITYIGETIETSHPLIDLPLKTDGVDLFVDHVGVLINCSRKGQIAMRHVLEAYLQRLERDEHGVQRLYPFTWIRPRDTERKDEPKLVVVDPRVAFGQPVIAGTRIRTSVVAERFRAGESTQDLAKDYGRELREIEEAIRCETKAA